MHLSDLQSKPVINMSDGRKLGVICDVDLDARTGRLISMMVTKEEQWWNRWRWSADELWIPWPHVVKIGADVILVRLGDANQTALERQMQPPMD